MCRFEVDRLTPFPEKEGDMWALWANHDCLNWEVTLTMIMDEQARSNILASTGIMFADQD